ncbi:hypothetical protein [Glaciihabitans sp. dw_435]|uniref:hypothetical protein n=1 Tax=Glaciihabitans sp. dw_435 TaxID=2720081 RepID=UPI001BD1E936|nr:hypothetical protein [Glaciihabitans sp. dw_435]
MVTAAERARKRKRAEAITDIVYWVSAAFYLVACLLPLIVIMIIGLIAGTVPTQAEGGVLGFADGYPAFNPQSWLLYVPALGVLFLSIWTFPLPLRSFPGASRVSLVSITFFMFFIGLLVSSAFMGSPGIENEGFPAVLIMLLALVLFIVRWILGALRLLPASWREAPTVRRRTPKKAVTNV